MTFFFQKDIAAMNEFQFIYLFLTYIYININFVICRRYYIMMIDFSDHDVFFFHPSPPLFVELAPNCGLKNNYLYIVHFSMIHQTLNSIFLYKKKSIKVFKGAILERKKMKHYAQYKSGVCKL